MALNIVGIGNHNVLNVQIVHSTHHELNNIDRLDLLECLVHCIQVHNSDNFGSKSEV